MGYWLKLYTDILDDKKVMRDMTDVGQLGMFFIFLAAKKGDCATVGTIDDLIFTTRKPEQFWKEALPDLIKAGIVTNGDGVYHVVNFDERQAAIEPSKRTSENRAKNNSNAFQNSCNEPVTENKITLQKRHGEIDREQRKTPEAESEEDEDAGIISFPSVWKQYTQKVTEDKDWQPLKDICATPDDLKSALDELITSGLKLPRSPDRCVESVGYVVNKRKVNSDDDYRKYITGKYANVVQH